MQPHRMTVENHHLAHLLTSLKTLGLGLLDTLLPPQCLACDTPVAADGQFCLACFRQVSFISAPFCRQCGVPLPYAAAAAQGLCTACVTAPPHFTQCRAPLRYDRITKSLILPFKYADRTEHARGLAILMARAGAALCREADLLVPVPLHKTRLRQRRYNQAVLLAAALSRLTGRPLRRDALRRHRATVPLGPLTAAARRAELTGAIQLGPGLAPAITGKTILLIDDVMTSGATADACAKTLLEAGAAQVNVLTAARVADPRYE